MHDVIRPKNALLEINKLFLNSQKGHTQQLNRTRLQNIFIKTGKGSTGQRAFKLI